MLTQRQINGIAQMLGAYKNSLGDRELSETLQDSYNAFMKVWRENDGL